MGRDHVDVPSHNSISYYHAADLRDLSAGLDADPSRRRGAPRSRISPSTPSPKARSRSGSFVPLQRFECVRVAKKLRRDGHRLYVAAVFLHRSEAQRRLSECVYKVTPASKLSSEAMHAAMMAERQPDFVVERRFSEFRQLRDSVVALVRADGAHVKTPKHQNWTVKRMFGNKEQRFALLTAFVDDLLALTASGSIAQETDANDCKVRERVAEMLQEFLKRKYKDSLGII
ncbi:Phox homologous domain [Phytophthora cactorum]|nr:Phox homologous domain [Phytophthora cactorum]